MDIFESLYAPRRFARALRAMTVAAVIAQAASSQPVPPTRTFSVRETVAARQTVAALAVTSDAVQLLVTDKAPTGRSAVLLRVDSRGNDRQWHDLKASAVALVNAGGTIAAFAPINNGLRLLQPTGDAARAMDLAGATAAATGDLSHLVRLLRNGDLAVHETDGAQIGPARVLATASILKTDSVCATCGSRLIIPSAYVFLALPGEKVAAVHRSAANFKLLDLKTGKLLRSTVLDNEDVARGRAMYAALPKPPASSNTSNPSLVFAGAARSSGDMFLLIGPFTPSEGARVIRVNTSGEIVGSLRCGYQDFRAEDGPPQFVGVNDQELYLASRAGHVRVYPLAGVSTP